MMKSKSSPFAYHKFSTISYAVSYLSTNRVALSSRPGHVLTMPYWIGALVTTAGLIILLVQFCRLLIAYNNFSFLTAGEQESIFEEKRSVENLVTQSQLCTFLLGIVSAIWNFIKSLPIYRSQS